MPNLLRPPNDLRKGAFISAFRAAVTRTRFSYRGEEVQTN